MYFCGSSLHFARNAFCGDHNGYNIIFIETRAGRVAGCVKIQKGVMNRKWLKNTACITRYGPPLNAAFSKWPPSQINCPPLVQEDFGLQFREQVQGLGLGLKLQVQGLGCLVHLTRLLHSPCALLSHYRGTTRVKVICMSTVFYCKSNMHQILLQKSFYRDSS